MVAFGEGLDVDGLREPLGVCTVEGAGKVGGDASTAVVVWTGGAASTATARGRRDTVIP